jgi:hypothetical protein
MGHPFGDRRIPLGAKDLGAVAARSRWLIDLFFGAVQKWSRRDAMKLATAFSAEFARLWAKMAAHLSAARRSRPVDLVL